ncbi:hypothetical protein F441_09773 [Phytophthora nicotianae CJ01A1]|uniref:Uncharacterized protein n=2 Tax=Phytophthora nicotianae TaxID=4792 RepID=W2GRH8_PHYNI|nr:hypothetical protein L915_09627 [Phytophthora nicotianae]ETL92176.1 hypothetical protein L917_09457 [Phytophthora nicotianae]ETP15495.1 hypothetical protein F441_09773 [Phytophthora nicotianae CJ01A1]
MCSYGQLSNSGAANDGCSGFQELGHCSDTFCSLSAERYHRSNYFS